MRYYEVHEPYYALIAAEDKEEAMSIYENNVAYGDEGTLKDHTKEVGRNYALGRYGNCIRQTLPGYRATEIKKEFEERKNDCLLIDGNLA
ncbi:hypothetical protein [Bacillus paralicheniformis]|uniref:hypothetical protein n=1 Tax=Bacillus paralicheniformis TaxID=1648923 RepID=UPI002040BD76|nr:hypothetical protein [Bacillus paralicheniformis]MCM3425530.1 hypothetical protein [Bacillus paralicheniformis]